MTRLIYCLPSVFSEPPAQEIPGMARFFARDPDGNRIEFVQRL